MSHKHGTDEVVVSLDSEHPSHLQVSHPPVDMVARLRKICRIFLVVFLVRAHGPSLPL